MSSELWEIFSLQHFFFSPFFFGGGKKKVANGENSWQMSFDPRLNSWLFLHFKWSGRSHFANVRGWKKPSARGFQKEPLQIIGLFFFYLRL